MALQLCDLKVLIRGGGEMASGIAHRLHWCGMKVLITEVEAPTAVRRTVAFAEAVYEGLQTIEGVKAIKAGNVDDIYVQWKKGDLPVLVDPNASIRQNISPDVFVDAIMAKQNSSTRISDAPLVIGVGPGLKVGVHVHAVVESNRGHNLGRVIWNGQAEANTGVPAPVDGHTDGRVLRVPRNGRFEAFLAIGDVVAMGEAVGRVDGVAVQAQISGLIRGLLRDGIEVQHGMKAGDIDPRGQREYCYSISDKARAISGGVLEAILNSLTSPRGRPRFPTLQE
jgi:xanthine dehydrogenase accessory factor